MVAAAVYLKVIEGKDDKSEMVHDDAECQVWAQELNPPKY